jgi:formate dehydrogenase subunit gamma
VSEPRVPRFDATERAVHWCTAILFLVLLATGAALYAGPISTLVGRRVLVKNVHVYAGLLLPIPVLAGLVLRSGRQLRRDVGRLSRWDREDRTWWRRSTRSRAELGKFNPGQKLNATFIAAAIVVMLATGSIMRWFEPFPDDWRTGATFVHDWFALGIGLSALGHIILALSDGDALRGMLRGSVSPEWARAKRPRWYAEVRGPSVSGASAPTHPAGASAPSGPVGDLVAGPE